MAQTENNNVIVEKTTGRTVQSYPDDVAVNDGALV
jgi:hypothetical protein